MVNLIYTELLKLKRSKMFFVSIIGSAAAPFMCFIMFFTTKTRKPHIPIQFSEVFSETNMFIMLLIGAMLYGVITSYLFNREYTEDTLKNLLTIPVSRTGIIISKLVLLLFWILALTVFAWILTIVLGFIGQFEGLNAGLLIESLKKYIIGGSFLFLLSTPVIFVTLIFKNYVPTIVFTIIITMINVLIVQSEYSALYPWSAVFVIAHDSFFTEYPPVYSYISILATSAMGFIATVIFFRKTDIH